MNKVRPKPLPRKERTGKSGWKLTEAQKAEIVVRITNGEAASELAREFGVTHPSITKLMIRRKHAVAQVSNNLIEQKERIIVKGLNLIEKKMDKANVSKKVLSDIKIDAISKVLNDLWKQAQIEKGKPTDIRRVNITELKLSLDNKLNLLRNGNLLEGNNGDISSFNEDS